MCTCSSTQNFRSVQITSLSPQIVKVCAIFIESLCLSNKILEAEQFIKNGLFSSQSGCSKAWWHQHLLTLLSASQHGRWQKCGAMYKKRAHGRTESQRSGKTSYAVLKQYSLVGELTHSVTLILGQCPSHLTTFRDHHLLEIPFSSLNTNTFRAKLLTHELVGDRLHLTITCYFPEPQTRNNLSIHLMGFYTE